MAVAGVVLLALVGSWAATSNLWSFHAPPNVDRGSHEVESAAEAFLMAWFADDRKAAEAFVKDEDLVIFPQWWKASRSASVASFGRSLDGTVTKIDATPLAQHRCSVRLSFEVDGREQQVFHEWVRNEGGWSIELTSANAGLD